MITYKLNEHILLMQEYKFNYLVNHAILLSTTQFFTKTKINEAWKVLPLFGFKDSMKVLGVIIYHYKEGKWLELVHLENFRDIDYISITDVGSAGYKIYNSSNIN